MIHSKKQHGKISLKILRPDEIFENFGLKNNAQIFLKDFPARSGQLEFVLTQSKDRQVYTTFPLFLCNYCLHS
jgi:hypothetical protein